MPALAALLQAALLLGGCGSQQSAPPTPDPVLLLQQTVVGLSRSVESVQTQVAVLSFTPTPVPSPTPAPPTPTPTPGLSLEDIEGLLDSRLAAVIEALPTPGPSLDEIAGLIDDRVTDAIAAIPTPPPTATPAPTPTPLSLPALVAAFPQVSGTAAAAVAGGITLMVDPGQPIAGRDVSFTLEGLKPWQEVEVEFLDPRGQPSEWITEGEARFRRVDDKPVTRYTLYADANGRTSWRRIGTLDSEGVWTVRLTIGSRTTSITYPVSQLQLTTRGTETVGIQFRRYEGGSSNAFYSAGVPSSLAVDLQAHLAWVVGRIQADYGIRSGGIPDIYLVGSKDALNQVSRALDLDPGFEDGFFKSSGTRPGIYMRADFFRTDLHHVLTHEYAHLLLAEVTENRRLATWLDEGIAEYIEHELGIKGERPDVSHRKLYLSADTARTAARQGTLVPLSALEGRADWNSQRDEDRIHLQYAQAHMIVRYLSETHGKESLVQLAMSMAGGASVADAVSQTIGMTYQELQDRFVAWLADWEEPRRAEASAYLESLDQIMEADQAISDRRNALLAASSSPAGRASDARALVNDTKALQTRVSGLSAPAHLARLHDMLTAYLETKVQWLSLELEYAQTLVDARRVEANEMIPEIQARLRLLLREASTARFNHHLDADE